MSGIPRAREERKPRNAGCMD